MESTDSDYPPIAAIDIGTNSIHLLIAKPDCQGHITVIDSDKVVLRLGDSIDQKGNLASSAINSAIVTLKHMQEIAASYAPIFRVVATQAIRVARNHREFTDRIYDSTGLRISIIDGEEEARLVALGMQEGLALKDKRFFGLDIGGGSSELVVCHGDQIDFVRSIELGAVSLNRMIPAKKTLGGYNFQDAELEIELKLAPLRDKRSKLIFDHAVFSSGLAKCLAHIHSTTDQGQQLQDANGYRLSAKNIKQICHHLCKLGDPQSIRKYYRLESERAEIVKAGTIILDRLTKFFGIDHWIISSFGLREGLILDTITRLDRATFNHQHDVRWGHILKLASKFRVNENYASQVSKLAVEIYDEIGAMTPDYVQSEQGTQLSDRGILQAAAWLHECGKFISFSRYHKHSLHIIANSNLMGFSQHERLLIGLTARFHRKGKAQTNSFECQNISQKACKRINYLASILRIAAAANRSRKGFIESVRLVWTDTQVDFIFTVPKNVTPELDLYKIDKEKHFFESIIKRTIQLKLENEISS